MNRSRLAVLIEIAPAPQAVARALPSGYDRPLRIRRPAVLLAGARWQPKGSQMQEALVVRRETHVSAPPAAVFALLTDPEKILRWMGTEADVEPKPEGLYLVNVTGARFARGSFREVVPVHRLAYSFGWDDSDVVPPGSSLVEIDLIEQPDGTLVRLTHSGLPNAEQCAGHAEGWAHYLDRLSEVAAGRDPGPDPWHGRTG
ncbi:transcriptional regulator [Sinorhizobium meliloti CCBAU 01290]|nr:transcriptional regulator [Sinorhizobium meliloti CCBAU 01290]